MRDFNANIFYHLKIKLAKIKFNTKTSDIRHYTI